MVERQAARQRALRRQFDTPVTPGRQEIGQHDSPPSLRCPGGAGLVGEPGRHRPSPRLQDHRSDSDSRDADGDCDGAHPI